MLAVCNSLLSVAVVKYWPKATRGGRSFWSYTLRFMEGNEGRKLRSKTEGETTEECCLWVCSLFLCSDSSTHSTGPPVYGRHCPQWAEPSHNNNKLRQLLTDRAAAPHNLGDLLIRILSIVSSCVTPSSNQDTVWAREDRSLDPQGLCKKSCPAADLQSECWQDRPLETASLSGLLSFRCRDRPSPQK